MNRRGFLGGLGAALAAPAVVPFASLMPVRGIVMPMGDPMVMPVGLLRADQMYIMLWNMAMQRYEFVSTATPMGLRTALRHPPEGA